MRVRVAAVGILGAVVVATGGATAMASSTAVQFKRASSAAKAFSVGDFTLAPKGVLRFKVAAPSRGTVEVLETDWSTNVATAASTLQPAKGRFVFARAKGFAPSAGIMSFSLAPNSRALKVLEHPNYPVRVRLWVSFVPVSGGQQQDIGLDGLALKR